VSVFLLANGAHGYGAWCHLAGTAAAKLSSMVVRRKVAKVALQILCSERR
jgi:hypothetical protein